MAYPRNRAQARALVQAFRKYEQTGRALQRIERCTARHPDVDTQCVLAKHRKLAQHRDGPIAGVLTRRW